MVRVNISFHCKLSLVLSCTISPVNLSELCKILLQANLVDVKMRIVKVNDCVTQQNLENITQIYLVTCSSSEAYCAHFFMFSCFYIFVFFLDAKQVRNFCDLCRRYACKTTKTRPQGPHSQCSFKEIPKF